MKDDDLPELTPAGDVQEERKRLGVERVYRNDQIAVSWEPKLCIHAGYCFRGLPHVFKPLERPWVDVNAASTDEIATTVMRCPTGALHFPRIAQRDKTSSEPVEKYASLMGKNKSVPNKEVYDEQYRRCVGENPDLFALGPFNAILVRGITPNKKPHC